MSVAEQRYQAVLALIAEGETVKSVADRWRVSRKTIHSWLARYEAEGLEGLADRSHRPVSCPHQMPGAVEAVVLEMRRGHPSWGARRIHAELVRRPRLLAELNEGAGEEVPSESAIYRCLSRSKVIDGSARRRRDQTWKRWERGTPNELWQMDVVGGFLLADGSRAKALTGIDDHSRFCVSAKLMPRERTQAVCDALALAMRTHGVPTQILTDNGKVFTGRFNHPPTEVLFDRICRENGVEHLLTQPRSPTTTGKIERFHRTLRADFDTARVFKSIRFAQAELDEWVTHYNHDRPHQAINEDVPAVRFNLASPRPAIGAATVGAGVVSVAERRVPAPGQQWITRKVGANGIVCVDWQQTSVGLHYAGHRCDVLVGEELFQFWIGDKLLKTVARDRRGPVRKTHAQGSRPTA
jgi:transposase InsO family protein